MKSKLFGLFVSVICVAVVEAQTATRSIAVTIDDLPVVSTRADLKNRQEITRKLLGHITRAKVPVVGFVNENKLYAGEQRGEAQIDLLRSWLKADLELGNHTFSHRSLSAVELESYESDILRGEIITKELLAASGKQIRYFRHPYLHTGLSLDIKNSLNDFLAAHRYTIAPVTMDNSDWLFSLAYDNAFDKADRNLMKRIGAAYLAYHEKEADYWERQSVKLFGREIKFILLLHANFINSDYFGDVAAIYRKRNYRFVTLEEALKDEAYRLPDTLVERNGISCIHRWALAKGRADILAGEPEAPDFVMRAAGYEPE